MDHGRHAGANRRRAVSSPGENRWIDVQVVWGGTAGESQLRQGWWVDKKTSGVRRAQMGQSVLGN
jgi:hypothetical protein